MLTVEIINGIIVVNIGHGFFLSNHKNYQEDIEMYTWLNRTRIFFSTHYIIDNNYSLTDKLIVTYIVTHFKVKIIKVGPPTGPNPTRVYIRYMTIEIFIALTNCIF